MLEHLAKRERTGAGNMRMEKYGSFGQNIIYCIEDGKTHHWFFIITINTQTVFKE